jgi:serine/threonine-protein kinase RsbW
LPLRSGEPRPVEVGARQVQLTVPAAVEGALQVRETARAFARRHLVPCPDDVALAVWEACVNVVTHAYRDGPPGPIEFAGARRGSDVTLTVADRGSGLRPDHESAGLGVGLIVIATLADACEIVTSGVGTRLGLRFRCGPDPAWAGMLVRRRRDR